MQKTSLELQYFLMLLYYQFIQNRSKIKGISLREHPVFSALVSRSEKKSRQLVKHMGAKNKKRWMFSQAIGSEEN